MKLRVSLSAEDIAALDRYVEQAGLPSRSAGIQQAVRLLGDREIEAAYAEAWNEWIASGDAESWERAANDA